MSSIKSKLSNFWRNSQTKAWAYVQGVGAAASGALVYTDSVFSSDQFKNLLGTLTLPHWVPPSLAGFALITYVVHGHKDS